MTRPDDTRECLTAAAEWRADAQRARRVMRQAMQILEAALRLDRDRLPRYAQDVVDTLNEELNRE